MSEDSRVGSVVGQLTVTDPDNARSPRQTHTYTLTDDAGGRFAMDGDTVVVSVWQYPQMVPSSLCSQTVWELFRTF